jgi:hypothetical protein
MQRLRRGWRHTEQIPARGLTCGHCNHYMSTDRGFYLENQGQDQEKAFIYICAHCRRPIFLLLKSEQVVTQAPGASFGDPVENVPTAIASLYDEARSCMKVSAFTSAVLGCRKLLMNIAVEEGADEGKRFIDYVEFLSDKGFVPPGGKHWVDHIRKQGNEATHEIDTKTEADATDLLSFVEMLLKFIYEFPAKVPISADEDD